MIAKAVPISLLSLALAIPAAAQPTGDPAKPGGEAGDSAEEKKSDGDGPAAPSPAQPGAIDVDALRQEYLKLRDRLFRSRARAATVASAVFSTRLQVNLYYTTGRFYTITRASIRLDGSTIFDDTEGVIARDKAPRFEGFVAPGRHRLEIRIEAVGKDDAQFESVLQSSFTVQAPGGKDVIVTAAARDAGDIPYRWKRKQSGSYKLRLDVHVDTKKRAAPASKKTSRAPLPLRKKLHALHSHNEARVHVARETENR